MSLVCRDPTSGLPVASIAFLPKALQDTLLRNQRGVVPLVLYAEWAFKLSENRQHRYTKERLILVTPDSLNVFAADGTIKRRIKIADLHALYVTDGYVEPRDEVQDDATSTQNSPPSRVVAGRAAQRRMQPRISVALEVPRQFDAAFDIVRDTATRCQSAANHLRRVLSVLYRIAKSTSPKHPGPGLVDLKVVSLPSIAFQLYNSEDHNHDSQLSYFRLKKAHAAGPYPHGRKGPLLAPVLPLVTREMEQAVEEDPQAQVEAAVAELVSQVRRYQEDAQESNATSAPLLQRMRDYCRRYNELQCERLRLERRREVIQMRSAAHQASAEAAAAALRAAREDFMQRSGQLSEVRMKHDSAIRAIRLEMEETDGRVAELQQREADVANETMSKLRQLDEVMQTEKAEVSQLEAALLWRRQSLPTLEALEEECEQLRAAIRQVELNQQSASEAHRRAEDMQHLQQTLSTENIALEEAASEAMGRLRESKSETQRLTGCVSMAMARRNKLAAQLERLRQSASSIQAEIEATESQLRRRQRFQVAEIRRIAVDGLEAIVTEDYCRERSIRHELMTSEATAALQAASVDIAKQEAIKAKLQRLRSARTALRQ